MIVHRLFLLSVAALAAASCTEGSHPLAPDALLSHSVAGHRVVGSGHVQTAAGQREFTFHAIEEPGGGVTGSYKVVLPNGLFFEADVTCMAVDGNTGWVAGIIRATNAGIVVVGSRSMFWARDDGEGEGAADVVSSAAFNFPEGTDLGFCEERPLILPPMTVTDGNVQVR